MALRLRAGVPRFGTSISPMTRGGLVWIGDKKPVQHADPSLRAFLYQHFSDARCIHLVRHPTAVIHSMLKQARGPRPWMDCWKLPPEQLLDAWCKHEEWVMNMKEERTIPILTISYSDLVEHTRDSIITILSFLDLPYAGEVVDRCIELTYSDADSQYRQDYLRLNERALAIIYAYGLRL
jgi:hypothetical protein